jgi:O-succinylbenzoic acid--CoA ligase
LDVSGRLVLHGRLDDVIVTGGVKVSPAIVESRLAAVPGVAESLVVGVIDPDWGQAVTAVVTAAGRAPTLEDVRAALADLPPAFRPRHLVLVDRLPILGPGKPDRMSARRIAQELLSSADDRPAPS